MKQALIAVGSPGRWARDATDDYLKRLRRWGGVDVVDLKPGRGADAMADEGRRILARVGPRDRLVVLDERGLDLDSHAFADLVREGLGAEGKLVWALGGAFGHDPAVRDAAWRVVRLSALVMNHDLARVVFAEQLYRAHTLLHGVPYHH